MANQHNRNDRSVTHVPDDLKEDSPFCSPKSGQTSILQIPVLVQCSIPNALLVFLFSIGKNSLYLGFVTVLFWSNIHQEPLLFLMKLSFVCWWTSTFAVPTKVALVQIINIACFVGPTFFFSPNQSEILFPYHRIRRERERERDRERDIYIYIITSFLCWPIWPQDQREQQISSIWTCLNLCVQFPIYVCFLPLPCCWVNSHRNMAGPRWSVACATAPCSVPWWDGSKRCRWWIPTPGRYGYLVGGDWNPVWHGNQYSQYHID